MASVIVSMLVGSAIISWPVRALWVSALFCVLTSIYIAAQQTMTLTRMHFNNEKSLRRLQYSFYDPTSSMPRKGWSKKLSDTILPSILAVCFWQLPAILLSFAIVLFVIGLNIWIFRAAVRGGDDKKVWNSFS